MRSVYEPVRSLRPPEGQPIGPVSWGGDRPYWNLIGNGGLLATAGGFIQFLQAVDAGQVISAASVELTRTAHVAEDAAGTSHYGYGLVVEDIANVGRISWHDGGNGVYSAEWMHVIGDDTSCSRPPLMRRVQRRSRRWPSSAVTCRARPVDHGRAGWLAHIDRREATASSNCCR